MDLAPFALVLEETLLHTTEAPAYPQILDYKDGSKNSFMMKPIVST
jgi:hypothetical protein